MTTIKASYWTMRRTWSLIRVARKHGRIYGWGCGHAWEYVKPYWIKQTFQAFKRRD